MIDSLRQSRLHNTRDVGGMRAADGYWTVSHKLYRSAAPLRPTSSLGRSIAAAGICSALDLRDDEERHASASWRDYNLLTLRVPIFQGHLRDLNWNELSDLYTLMITEYAPQLGAAASALAEAPKPLLVHCTAGKDRTGVLIALILDALDVSHDHISADYHRSQSLLGQDYLDDLNWARRRAGLPGVRAHSAVASPPELITDMLDAVAEVGGAMAFLSAHGVTDEQWGRIRTELLTTIEPDPDDIEDTLVPTPIGAVPV